MSLFQKAMAGVPATSSNRTDDIQKLERYLKALAANKLDAPPPQVQDASLQPLAGALQAFVAQQAKQAHDIVMTLNDSLA